MENKKREFNRYLIITSMVLALLIGFSYAFFSTPGGETDINGKMSENFDITLASDNNGYIDALSFVPIQAWEVDDYSEKTYFSVITGANDHPVSYTVLLTNLEIPEELKDEYFKWGLICTSCTENPITASGNFKVIAEDISVTLKEGIKLNPNSQDDYELRLWIENDPNNNQIGMNNKTFKGKITVTAYMVYENQETD